MSEPLPLVYIVLAVIVVLLIGTLVLGVLLHRDITWRIACVSERMEARRKYIDRVARVAGCHQPRA